MPFFRRAFVCVAIIAVCLAAVLGMVLFSCSHAPEATHENVILIMFHSEAFIHHVWVIELTLY